MREIRDRARFRAHLQGARLRLRAQSGFALIEVVVSAALLLVVASGVLAGIEGPARTSAKDETRSQATDLAQQDQERLRSMTFSSLVGYTQTTPVTVGGVTYSRYSSAVWIHDNGDPDSCNTQANASTGDYLKITSRVTPPATSGPPVQVDSLMATPPGQYSNKGTLAVLLTNHLNQPVVGQSVSIAGPVNMTVPTNSVGCAVFGAVDRGTYTATFSRAGWVDPAAVTAVSIPTSVTANSTTIVPHLYAPSGRINVTVDTQAGAPPAVLSPAKAVMVSNGGIPTGTLTFNAPATPPPRAPRGRPPPGGAAPGEGGLGPARPPPPRPPPLHPPRHSARGRIELRARRLPLHLGLQRLGRQLHRQRPDEVLAARLHRDPARGRLRERHGAATGARSDTEARHLALREHARARDEQGRHVPAGGHHHHDQPRQARRLRFPGTWLPLRQLHSLRRRLEVNDPLRANQRGRHCPGRRHVQPHHP